MRARQPSPAPTLGRACAVARDADAALALTALLREDETIATYHATLLEGIRAQATLSRGSIDLDAWLGVVLREWERDRAQARARPRWS